MTKRVPVIGRFHFHLWFGVFFYLATISNTLYIILNFILLFSFLAKDLHCCPKSFVPKFLPQFRIVRVFSGATKGEGLVIVSHVLKMVFKNLIFMFFTYKMQWYGIAQLNFKIKNICYLCMWFIL